LREKQPRALVILAAAKIDTQLRSLLEAFLLTKKAKPKDADELLDGENPLSTLSARTKICHRLGLIDSALADALDRLRDIRNQAAHWISFGVSDAPLRDQCKHLKSLIASRRSYKLTVDRFFFDMEMKLTDDECQDVECRNRWRRASWHQFSERLTPEDLTECEREIRVLDSTGGVERTSHCSEADRKL